jgi:hypothetical protein
MATGDVTDYLYPLDETGAATTNLVSNEKRTLNPPDEDDTAAFNFHFILPWAGPYFRDTMVLTHTPTGRTLIRGTDWAPGHKFDSASYELQSVKGGVYASVLFYDQTLSGEVVMSYQTLGGTWTLDENTILEIMSNLTVDPRSVTFEQVSGKPDVYPPSAHNHPVDDLTGMAETIAATYDISAAIREQTNTWLTNPPVLMSEYYTKDEVDAKFAANNLTN